VTATPAPRRPRALRLVAVGLAATTLGVAGAGIAVATRPASAFAAAVEDAVQAVGIDWSAMPAGYTREQYTAFWDAGYQSEDVDALAQLWAVDATEAKARAGQLLLDGRPVPVAASGTPGNHVANPAAPAPADEVTAQIQAYFDAGYTGTEAEALAALWQTDFAEAKARAGQLLLDGQTLPVPAAPAAQG
jgi:hypothetical protein